mmetsp:Transcript_42968/g.48787  ORF Transcript_42968/g.48787 Transcript_42968/m.48787 type:complete len:285 (+) Transcript_42968:50-904(+)|eukprot:CAMPEP_0194149956 /NCGR_PEP_ID=MMETSP0152-20130528/40752_1 /TAXON_ID=1049557 /ORGANISM="Thalassiothrix antarctica, Strain L6-D1" /LENGTH=284 /DNA_ID=CAMNT_0038852525 /DNA_START=27 /DNA_END=881 /DNA_ORIENTATION=-
MRKALPFGYILASACNGTIAFPVTRLVAREPSTQLYSSPEDTSFLPMSRADVENWLANIPVYTVMDNSQQRLILLKEKGNDKEIANFFFTPEDADAMYAPFKKDDEGIDWNVSQLKLGQIWFDCFLKNEKIGIEYRLVPDSIEVAKARKLVEHNSGISESPKPFQTQYNQIPVFLDQKLRVKIDGADKVPMYLNFQNCLSTCQQAMDNTTGIGYEWEIIVVELTSLLNQMQEENPGCDFRETSLIPSVTEKEKKHTSVAAPPLIKEDNKDNKLQLMSTDDLWED